MHITQSAQRDTICYPSNFIFCIYSKPCMELYSPEIIMSIVWS